MRGHDGATRPGEPVALTDGQVECHDCEETYDRIGTHWSQGRCEWPDIPTDKRALVTGIMLGDGTLRTRTTYPFVQVYQANKPFLDWLDDQLGWLSTGVSLERTAAQSAEYARTSGGQPDATAETYHDVYALQTRTMPQFRLFEEWYTDEGKQLPKYLTLTPPVAKMWYVSDGSLNFDRRYPNARPYASIGMRTDLENPDAVERLFRECPIDVHPTLTTNGVRFTVDETERFLDWIGPAPPGFSYKFQREGPEKYDELREQAMAGED